MKRYIIVVLKQIEREDIFPPDSIVTKISNPSVSHKMDKNGGIFYFLPYFAK